MDAVDLNDLRNVRDSHPGNLAAFLELVCRPFLLCENDFDFFYTSYFKDL